MKFPSVPVASVFIPFFLFSSVSHAAGLIMRQQQMKAMRQQQRQQGTLQEQQEYLRYQQSMATGQQQEQSEQAPAPLTYQQQVDQRNQAITQAITDANGNAVTVNNPDQQKILPTSNTAVKEVVDLAEVWKKLDKKSAVWTILADKQAKVLTVAEYMDRFHKQGVKITQTPYHYVQMIDQMVTQTPAILQRPFGELLQIAAILDYDFDNGIDKDVLAIHVLGEQGYETNKKRLGR
jgi:hypothetical protein